MTRLARTICVAALLPVAVVTIRAAPQATAPQSDDAAGTAAIRLIQSVCGSCHTSGSILGQHRTPRDWAEVIEWMFDEGAVMTDDEYEQLMAFLGVRYGLVAVNTAPAAEVRTVLELTDDQTQRIVDARESGRHLRTLDEVADVLDMLPSALSGRADRIDFSLE